MGSTVKRVAVGLGSNLGDRQGYLAQAREALGALPDTRLTVESPLYETPPWGYLEQGAFLNQVVGLGTTLGPESLLDACQTIEKTLGRERPFRNAPRTLDIDLLLYEEVTQQDWRLNLPHPGILERDFVYVPLLDCLRKGDFFAGPYWDDWRARLSTIHPWPTLKRWSDS